MDSNCVKAQPFDLVGSSVRLRRLGPLDRAGVVDLLSDAQAMRFIGPRRAMDQDEIDGWMESNMAAYEAGWSRWAVALAETDEFVGMAGLKPQEGGLDFGLYFCRRFWGAGIALDAAEVALDAATEYGMTFTAFVASENTRSLKLMERFGWAPARAATLHGEDGFAYESGDLR